MTMIDVGRKLRDECPAIDSCRDSWLHGQLMEDVTETCLRCAEKAARQERNELLADEYAGRMESRATVSTRTTPSATKSEVTLRTSGKACQAQTYQPYLFKECLDCQLTLPPDAFECSKCGGHVMFWNVLVDEWEAGSAWGIS